MKMTSIELYRNYGTEKTYSYSAPIASATTSEKIRAEFADGIWEDNPWDDGWTIEENETGKQLLCSPWGQKYTWDMVLEGDKTPCIHVVDNDGNDRTYPLTVHSYALWTEDENHEQNTDFASWFSTLDDAIAEAREEIKNGANPEGVYIMKFDEEYGECDWSWGIEFDELGRYWSDDSSAREEMGFVQ